VSMMAGEKCKDKLQKKDASTFSIPGRGVSRKKHNLGGMGSPYQKAVLSTPGGGLVGRHEMGGDAPERGNKTAGPKKGPNLKSKGGFLQG